jgi:hypothetical protein
MPWTRVALSPGIVKDVTRYGAGGTWVDSNLVRFRDGFPERWKGWERYFSSTILDGICRSLNRWALLSGYVYLGIGTNRRFYIANDASVVDVTPVRRNVTLNNAIHTTSGSLRVVIDDVAHGAVPGNIIVISGATAVGGLTTDQLNTEHLVAEYVNADSYSIYVTGTPASSTATGGGAAIEIDYLFYAGPESYSYGRGWGTAGWGEDLWGGYLEGEAGAIGAWSQSNWGEDLIACAYDGPIFYWDADNPLDRMIDIRDLPGADGNAPEYARFIAVSHRDRHLLAFGPSNEYGGSEYAPMTVRWCSQEDIYNWNESDLAGTAGSIPLSRGSNFVAVVQTGREFLVWTDAALYSLQFVGAPDVYIADIISDSTDIVGMNAGTAFGNTVFWMGKSGFYVYDGRVSKLPCPVWTYVQRDIEQPQMGKVFCSTNRSQNEVIWFYQSTEADENDKYVAYDVIQNSWTTGELSRTAWMDMAFQYPPLAVNADGKMLNHESGNDDGEQDPPVALNAYVESAPFELSSEGAFDKGDRFMFIRRILTDVTFMNYDGVNTPQMTMTLKMMDKPGGGFKTTGNGSISESVLVITGPEEFTDELHVRLRGRSLTVRLESDTVGSYWRSGMPRFDIRTDGQR